MVKTAFGVKRATGDETTAEIERAQCAQTTGNWQRTEWETTPRLTSETEMKHETMFLIADALIYMSVCMLTLSGTILIDRALILIGA